MLFVLLMACVSGASAVSTQTPLPPQFRSRSDIVEVYATVKLRNGTVAHDLTKDDFELREDGKPREIAVFSRSIQPLSVAMVLDHSGSTSMEFANVRMAAQEFVARLLRGDRASIGTLTWDCQPFTGDLRTLMTVLEMELPGDFGSPIWAAADRAMDWLQPEGGRRVVLLFSDGQDNQQGMLSAVTPGARQARPSFGFASPCESADLSQVRGAKDVLKRAERDAIMAYVVSVGGGTGELERLSKQTGGSYQRLGGYEEVKAAFRSVADELHLQYVLGFAPTFTDGQAHKIDVRAKRPGVTVQARKSYVAASGRQPETATWAGLRTSSPIR
jgi:Ca-activated chloride channel family protein